jgi:hypothetical protein
MVISSLFVGETVGGLTGDGDGLLMQRLSEGTGSPGASISPEERDETF